MSRTADSLQNVWQTKFQEHQLNPFTSTNKGLRYQQLESPAFWWHNPTNYNSLRLTRPAFNVLQKQSQIENWKFELPQDILPKTMLLLERHFKAPYFIHNLKTVYIYDDREAMILALHGNNLHQYLVNLEDSD